MTDLRARRTALGWSRRDLAAHARVDTSVLQLLELGLSADEESRARCEAALLAEEQRRGVAPPPEKDPPTDA